MTFDPKQLAERLGLEIIRRDGPTASDGWPIADVTIGFFKEGAPDFSFVALDSELIPTGVPVETFREEIARDGGALQLPDGTLHPVSIPDDIRDGESFYVSIKVTRLKPGARLDQLPFAGRS